MTPEESARTRLELARGHWKLGEADEAVACLRRVAMDRPEAEGLLELIDDFLCQAEQAGSAPVAELLAEMRRELSAALDPEPSAPAHDSPIATATLAALLAEQGHEREALAVADNLLRQNPEDTRAHAVRERIAQREAIARLERWLAHIERQRQGGVQA